MKEFNTLQELWSYCLFCPICRDVCRDIIITIGPDTKFQLISFKKKDHILYLYCTYKQKKIVKYNINFEINTINNTYRVEALDIVDTSIDDDMTADRNLEEEEKNRQRYWVTNLYFFFHIHSDCKKCGIAYVNTADIDLETSKKIISNFQIEREVIYIFQDRDKYHLTISYDTNKIFISKCSIDEVTYDIIDDDKTFECPIINFDFSNPQKVINKIKTLITFS